MQLPVPRVRANRFEAGKIHIAAETIHEFQISCLALGACVAGMGVKPMLKRIHHSHPRKETENAFQMRLPRTVCFSGRVKFSEKFTAEQFHRH